MRVLWAVLMLSGCTCYDSAYEKYCLSHPCAGGGGDEAGGGGAAGGGATGGGSPDSGAGGGSSAGGGGGGGMAPVDALALNVGTPFKATTCQSANIVLHDGTTHLEAPASADTPIALDGGAGVTFFSALDPSCTSAPITSVTLLAQQSSVDFYLRVDGFGDATLTATSPPLVAAQQAVTSTALARLISTTDTIPTNTGCPVQLPLRVVDEDTKSIPVLALADSKVHFVPTASFIGFGTSTCMNTSGFDVMLSAGQSAATLYAGTAAATPCGTFSTLTMSSMNLAAGLSLDGSMSSASFYYLKYPPLVACTSDPQCCNGTCQMQQCN
jgi:hypothetical protein